MHGATIHIVTLGHSQVGKTTYMASLYGELQTPYGGFTLRTTNQETHDELVAISKAVREQRYPLPTSHRSTYEFWLYFDQQPILRFTWADYRGGALRDKSTNEEALALQEELGEADGLMMLCDAHALASGRVLRGEIGRMTVLLSHTVAQVPRPLSLALVLTKCDMLEQFDRPMLTLFNQLLIGVAANEQIAGALIPVSCGRRMVNTPMPLFFALHAALARRTSETSILASQHENTITELEGKNRGTRRMLSYLKSAVVGSKTMDQQMFEAQRTHEESQHDYRRLQASLTSVESWVTDLPQISPSASLETYVTQLNRWQKPDPIRQTGQIDPFDFFS